MFDCKALASRAVPSLPIQFPYVSIVNNIIIIMQFKLEVVKKECESKKELGGNYIQYLN